MSTYAQMTHKWVTWTDCSQFKQVLDLLAFGIWHLAFGIWHLAIGNWQLKLHANPIDSGISKKY